MHRRSLLTMFGFGAAASVLPNIPVATAKPQPKPNVLDALAAEFFKAPLYAVATVAGIHDETLRYHMPVRLHRREDYSIAVMFDSTFTGKVQMIEIVRGADRKGVLVTISPAAMDTSDFVRGDTVTVIVRLS